MYIVPKMKLVKKLVKRDSMANELERPWITIQMKELKFLWSRSVNGAHVNPNLLDTSVILPFFSDFRLIVNSQCRFYFILALVAIVIYLYRTWVNQIWPEIRGWYKKNIAFNGNVNEKFEISSLDSKFQILILPSTFLIRIMKTNFCISSSNTSG